MKSIELPKEDVRDIVAANKQSHEAAFYEATKIFYATFYDNLTALTDRVSEEKINYREVRNAILDMCCPSGYCDEYERVLDMIDREIGPTLVLSENEFKEYVRDEWGWKFGFAKDYEKVTGKALGS